MNRETITDLWEAHKEETWPQLPSEHEGPLMTLDTVIGGCVVYYLDSSDGLDEQRRGIIGDCLLDLESLEPDLDEESRPYFRRLRELGTLLLIAAPG
ncbi:hypothetical protein W02_27160 [Nitrospira sp. KM1]|uniref:hypothetical protein n=1 Tax=Nitrospira sp. KM1 TaxID=1936990 RepID=UPI0013A75EB6|nr:hypothetical protein [Nitrospira sp. KM1]BCA55576.1 hypothetical protein W02_27160 [Nitrospira sp. KM1]